FAHGLKGVPWPVSAIGVERDDCLSPETVLTQEALHGRRQLHIPGWKADKDEIILIRSVDNCLERWQIACLILADDLLYSGVIVRRIRRLQFETDQFAANLFVDDVRDGLGVVRSRQINNQNLLLRGQFLAFRWPLLRPG